MPAKLKAGAGFFGLEILTNTEKIAKLGKLLRAESNGTELRRDLIRNLRAAVQPGVEDVRAKLSALPSGVGTPALGGFLRARTRTQVRLAGRDVGVRVRIGQTPTLRDFAMAARRLNAKSWRRRIFGRGWTVQVSPIPGFFDDTLYGRRDEYAAAVMAAVRKSARRLGERL